MLVGQFPFYENGICNLITLFVMVMCRYPVICRSLCAGCCFRCCTKIMRNACKPNTFSYRYGCVNNVPPTCTYPWMMSLMMSRTIQCKMPTTRMSRSIIAATICKCMVWKCDDWQRSNCHSDTICCFVQQFELEHRLFENVSKQPNVSKCLLNLSSSLSKKKGSKAVGCTLPWLAIEQSAEALRNSLQSCYIRSLKLSCSVFDLSLLVKAMQKPSYFVIVDLKTKTHFNFKNLHHCSSSLLRNHFHFLIFI